jgi:hypothetical protein
MLTPEQVRDLVEWAGSQRAAARAIGVDCRTVYRWLHIEEVRRSDRERTADPRRREQTRAAHRRMRRRRIAQGLCSRCGQEQLLGAAACWTCLNEMEANRALAI